MGITASIFVLAFPAFIGWLTIRIINRREKWAKRTALALCLALAYPLSFGPACWITSWLNVGSDSIPVIYRPMALLIKNGPTDLYMPLLLFARSGADSRWNWSHNLVDDEIRWEKMPAAMFPVPAAPIVPVNTPAPTPDATPESN